MSLLVDRGSRETSIEVSRVLSENLNEALIISCQKGSASLVSSLINHGADANFRTQVTANCFESLSVRMRALLFEFPPQRVIEILSLFH
jgi:hypothetical protein